MNVTCVTCPAPMRAQTRFDCGAAHVWSHVIGVTWRSATSVPIGTASVTSTVVASANCPASTH